jgi:hypothetical protein
MQAENMQAARSPQRVTVKPWPILIRYSSIYFGVPKEAMWDLWKIEDSPVKIRIKPL